MTIKSTKQAISTFAFRCGITQRLVTLQGRFKSGELNPFGILIYHRVNDFEDPFTIDSVHASDFDDQMRYLAKHYRVLSLDEIYNRIEDNRNLPPNCLAITFDDGYADNYTFAYQILKKYNLPATIFVTAGCVDSKQMLWFDQVLSAFKGTPKKRCASPLDGVVFDLLGIEQRLRAAHTILEQLKKSHGDQKKGYISDLLDELGGHPDSGQFNRSELLTWDQVREMADNNMSIGSHTMTHPILATLSALELRWELEISRQFIEMHIRKPVKFFAYPNGKPSDYNGHVIQAVKQAGYKAAVTTSPTINRPVADSFFWGRYKPWQNRVEHFSASLFLHGLR